MGFPSRVIRRHAQSAATTAGPSGTSKAPAGCPSTAPRPASIRRRKELYFFGGLEADRVQITGERDLELEGASTSALNHFVYPHVEVDGAPRARIERRFSFEDV
jgi:hypothetical protein